MRSVPKKNTAICIFFSISSSNWKNRVFSWNDTQPTFLCHMGTKVKMDDRKIEKSVESNLMVAGTSAEDAEEDESFLNDFSAQCRKMVSVQNKSEVWQTVSQSFSIHQSTCTFVYFFYLFFLWQGFPEHISPRQAARAALLNIPLEEMRNVQDSDADQDSAEWNVAAKLTDLNYLESATSEDVTYEDYAEPKQFFQDGKRKYRCGVPNCSFERSTRYAVLRHVCVSHGLMEEQKCHICGHFSASLDSLNQHRRGCSINGPAFTCDFKDCTYATCYKSNLCNHKLTHFPPKLSCTSCGKKFRYRRDLKKHNCQ